MVTQEKFKPLNPEFVPFLKKKKKKLNEKNDVEASKTHKNHMLKMIYLALKD